jgi:CDP-diacylglycerol--glycerol-3-phosphate 3-phosphatidyltransferase
MKKSSIPNLLTFARGIFTLIIFVLFFIPFSHQFLWIFGIFLLASITDFLDGYLARKWKVESTIGVVFDSLFDKILILSLFFLLAPYDIIHPAFFLLLFLREIFVDGLKNYLLSIKKAVPSIFIGKLKMNFQIGLVASCLLALEFPEISWLVSSALFFAILSIISAYWSGWEYVKIFLESLKEKN